MSAARSLQRRTKAWQILFCLVVVSFLCRALIPPGYMPGAGVHDGMPAMALCDGTDGASLSAAFGHPQPPAPDHGHAQHPCPFCVAAAQVALPWHAVLAVAAMAIPCRVIRVAVRSALPSGTTLGSPLGSRAPPARLV